MCIRDSSGTPGAANVGSNGVTLTVSDGTTSASQTFTINVSPASIATTSDLPVFRVYPNPVSDLSLIHISEPTRLLSISYAVFCLKKKKKKNDQTNKDMTNTNSA